MASVQGVKFSGLRMMVLCTVITTVTLSAFAQRFEILAEDVGDPEVMFAKAAPLLRKVPLSQKRGVCKLPGRVHDCVRPSPTTEIFMPPLPPYIPADLESAAPISNLYYLSTIWVPPSQVAGGATALKSWQAALEQRRVFGCDGSECLTIRELFVSDNFSGSILGVCRTPQSATYDSGAPSCMPLVLVQNAKVWIRAFLTVLPIGGEGETHFRIFAPPGTNMLPIIDAFVKQLTGAPWDLKARRRDFDVTASGPRRLSKVVTGWRERLSIYLNGYEGEQDNEHGRAATLSFELATVLYVNRQNTTRPNDWHMPPPEVDGLYQERLLISLKSAMAAACRAGRWWDSETFLCNLPARFVPEPPL